MYTMKDITEKTKIPASTIRYYEELGILENVEHKDGYHRVFTDAHFDRLSTIECFKRAGLSLSEIKVLFELEKDMNKNSGTILEMMKKQEQKTLQDIENLKTALANIQRKIKYFSAVDEAVKEGRRIPSWCEVFK